MEPTRIKQVIVYRRDLKMRKGKIAAQVAHASMKVVLDRAERDPENPEVLQLTMTPEMAQWVWGAFTKVVLSVEGEEALLKAYQEASARGLPCALITDSGRTEFRGQPTHTAVAIGPAAANTIDKVTGRGGIIETRLA